MKIGKILVIFIIVGWLGFGLPGQFLQSWAQKAIPLEAERKLPKIIDKDKNKIFDNLEELLEGQPDGAVFDTIVLFEEPLSAALFENIRGRIGAFSIKYQYPSISGIAATLTKGQIIALSKIPFIKQIEHDGEMKAFLDKATHWFGVQKARTDFGVNGNLDGAITYSKGDIVIVVVDTGIDTGHKDLDCGKVIGWKDIVKGKTAPYDDNGHGTHCASIAAGEGAGDPAYTGVAPGAALVGVKVLDRKGSGLTSDCNAGIEWVIANKAACAYGIEIMSISWGTSGSSDGTDSTSLLCNNAVTNGIVTVVAAGNDGPAKYTIGSPAAAANVITVGAMADVDPGPTGSAALPEKGFYQVYFSSRGPTADDRIKPDISAPGVAIMAADNGTTNGYISYNGTSMSTPFTAGVAGLMLHANPTLSPSGVKSIIAATAIDWAGSGGDIDYGAGRLDAYEAIKSAGGYSDSNIVTPGHKYLTSSLTGTGDADWYNISVTDATYPIAITFITPDWTGIYAGPLLKGASPDFDIFLYAYDGTTKLASSEGIRRQETIGYQPDTTGTYKLKVYSYYGSGTYFCDTSAGGDVPTLVLLSGFRAYGDSGRAVVHWETSSEAGTAGFYLLRLDEATGKYRQVNDKLLPGLLHSPQGGIYRYVDETAFPGGTYTYKLVEVETRGNERYYGPFTVTVDSRGAEFVMEPMRGNYSREVYPISDAKKARLQARKAAQEAAKALRRWRTGSKVKIAVAEKGLYYLDAGDIASSLGLPYQRIGMMIRDNQLQLSNRGQKVAIIPAEGNSGIYFYGEGLEDSIYARENIYWLERGEGLTMELTEGGWPHPAGGYETFTETVHVEEDRYALTALFRDPEADYWLWDYIVSGHSKTFTLRSDGAAAAGEATLIVHLKGATDSDASPDHHVVVTLNGTKIGESQWDGTVDHEFVLHFAQQSLNDGDNRVEITGVLDAGVPYSIFYVDSFDLSYQRHYRAVGNVLPARGDCNPVVTIGGFTSPGIFVFEVTYPREPKLVIGTTLDSVDGTYRVSFRPISPDSLYLALTVDGLSAPVSIFADMPSNLKWEINGADYLVIAPEELKEAAQRLAHHRQWQRLKTMVVGLEDIYDEFNYGISSPEAIKEFLSYAYHRWRNPSRYVVLAGEGTYDYKDYQGYGDNLVPPILVSTPHGLFASDNRFVDVAGDDGVPEMCIGRLPVVTAEELHAFIDKMIAYKSARSGDWERRVLMLADNPDDGGDFPGDSDDVAALLPSKYRADKIYLSDHTTNEARQLALDGINSGAVLLNYIGHAGLDRLAQERLLATSDVSALTNQERLPVVTAMSCVVGRFAIPGYDSLSEALVLKSGGGAIAVWAPTGLSLNSQSKCLDEDFFRATFEEGEKTLGEAVLKALKDYAARSNEPHMLDIYNLLGDPALEMR